MDCDVINQSTFLEYHFGCLSESDRNTLEQHLLVCQECLQAFFATKRLLDGSLSETIPAEPSENLRLRLLESVRKEFGPIESARSAKNVTKMKLPWYTVAFATGLVAATALILTRTPSKTVDKETLTKNEFITNTSTNGEQEDLNSKEGRSFETDASQSLTESAGVL